MQRNRINLRALGIMGGIVLLVGLLAPFTMGSSEEKLQRLFRSGEDLYGQGDYEGAIAKFTKALEESTKEGANPHMIDKDFTTWVHYKIAVSYSRLAHQSGDVSHYKTAIDYIKKVALTATVPQHQEALTYLWAYSLYQMDQLKQAELKFKQVIAQFPDSFFVENAWYLIGQANYKLQDYEDARQAFKAVLDSFPNSDFKDNAQHLIAQSFLNESNYEQAYQEFDKFTTEAFKSYPGLQAEAMYKAAYSLNRLGREDEAIEHYTNFIRQFSDSPYVPRAYFDQGAIYAKQKNYHNARINYERALRAITGLTRQSEIQSAIGRTYFDQEDYDNAVVVYTNLEKKYPKSNFIAEAKLGVADSHFRLKDWDEATITYKQIINEYKNVSAYYGLARVYHDTSRWALLLEIADEANKEYATSDDKHVLDTLTTIASLRDIAIKNIDPEVVK